MSTRFAPWRADHHRPTGEVLAGLAAKQDLAAVVELAEAHSGVKGGWAERLCDDLSGEGRALFAAWANGTVAGYGRVRRFTPPEQAPANTAPAGWYLGGLLVAPQWRRCGAAPPTVSSSEGEHGGGSHSARNSYRRLITRERLAAILVNGRDFRVIALISMPTLSRKSILSPESAVHEREATKPPIGAYWGPYLYPAEAHTKAGPVLAHVDIPGDDEALDLKGPLQDRVVPPGPSSASGETLFVLATSGRPGQASPTGR